MKSEWKNRLLSVMSNQVNMLFMVDIKKYLTEEIFESALRHTYQCMKGFCLNRNGEEDKLVEISIRPFYSLEYTCFLYWISREFYLANNNEIASYLYYLNKSLNCVELFYEVELPQIWWCEHPLGTIMGKAKYGDYFFFYQGCTVGGNFKRDGSSIYPIIGNHVKMLSNSKVIGNSRIGNNVIISAGTYIKDQDVPNGVIVFGNSPDLVFKHNHFIDGCSVESVLSK